MARAHICIAAALVAALASVRAHAAPECSFSAGGQGRQYDDDSGTQRSYHSLGSITGEASCSERRDSQGFSAKLFARLAQHDSRRSHLDVRELVWSFAGEQVSLSAGIDQVHWGVMEFSRVVDIVNQSDVLEDPFGEVKLGQPLLSAGFHQPWGAVSAFMMPRFRTRQFPRLGEPLRAAPPVDMGRARFESDEARDRWDVALRYALTHGPLDLGLSYFNGTSRDPGFVFEPDAQGRITAAPYYALIEQIGLDAQLTLGQWALKLEGAHRQEARGSNDAYSLGLEYAFVGLAGTPIDVTVATEYVSDHRAPARVPGFLERDVALGVRVALNDARSTEGRFGLIVDRERHSEAWAFELGSRIVDGWKLELQARWFRNVDRRDPLYVIRDDSYLDLALIHYF